MKVTDLGIWKNLLCSNTGIFNTIKMLIIFLKLIYRFNTIPTKMPTRFLIDVNKAVLKFKWKDKGIRINNFEKYKS